MPQNFQADMNKIFLRISGNKISQIKDIHIKRLRHLERDTTIKEQLKVYSVSLLVRNRRKFKLKVIPYKITTFLFKTSESKNI